MERLTKKTTRDEIYDCDYVSKVEEKGLLDKLGPIEDLEEELGVDVVTFLKALKGGAYYKHPAYGPIPFEVEAFADGKGKKKIMLGFARRLTSIAVPTDSYGVKWALTREELE